MSAELMGWALKQDIPPVPRLVFIAICDQISDQPGKEKFWGSQAWLAEKLHMSERAIRGHLKTLEDQGWIKREKRDKEAGEYKTDLISICTQRQEPAAGKKTSNPAARNGRVQRQEPAAKNLTENLKENLSSSSADAPTPRFEEFWVKSWKKERLQNKNESKSDAEKAWRKLNAKEKHQAFEFAPAFQRLAQQENGKDCPMLHCVRYLRQKRWEGLAEASDSGGAGAGYITLKNTDPGYWEWVDHLERKTGDPYIRSTFEIGGEYFDRMIVESQFPPEKRVPA